MHGVQFVLLGLENQEHIHYAMPMRVMGYDYGAYKKQYDSNAKKYKGKKNAGLSEDEYLSRMKKTDKLAPVITVVIYYGEKPWDGAKTMHEMLHIPAEMTKYVNDYKLLLVEARENKIKLHNANNRDLFELLQIFLDRNAMNTEIRQRAIEYGETHKIEREVLMTVAGATNHKLEYMESEGSNGSMCTFFDELVREGEEKGLREGGAKQIVEMGHEFGLSEHDILERLQKKLEIPFQIAQEYLQMFGKQTV